MREKHSFTANFKKKSFANKQNILYLDIFGFAFELLQR